MSIGKQASRVRTLEEAAARDARYLNVDQMRASLFSRMDAVKEAV
jgi:hypothetical protein